MVATERECLEDGECHRPSPHPLAILLPVLIVCLGDDVGQVDEKEVYFYRIHY